MGSHFYCWIGCNEVAFSLELLEWDRTFSGLGGAEIKIQVGNDIKMARFLLH